MKLVVGLGNPGEKYENTRHNVGFMVVEKLVDGKKFAKSKGAPLVYSWTEVNGEKIEVIKPQTFMNNSGEAVVGPFRKHPGEMTTDDLYVVHDDLDIVLGDWKIDYGKGPKDHRGIQSIEVVLKTKEFWRVRVGVDNRASENRVPGEDYVLYKFNRDEQKLIDEIVEEVTKELRKKLGGE